MTSSVEPSKVFELRSAEGAALLVLTALAVLPLWVGRFLPLFDYPAHLVVPAAMLHASDPAMRIDELYVSRPGLNPNSLHYAVTFVLGHVVSIEVASKLFLSLAVAALPWAMIFALRTFGRDWRLAFLAAPMMLGRGFFYGFVGHCAALPLSLIALSLVARECRASSRARQWSLVGVMTLLPFAHFFTMLLTVAAAVLVVWRERGRWNRAWPLATAPAVMLPWFVTALLHPSAPSANAGLPFANWASPRESVAMLSHWFFDLFANHFDEALAVSMILMLAAVYGLRSLTGKAVEGSSTPLVLGLSFAVGYFVLPFELHRPFEWWAMNVRLIPLAYFWLIIAAPIAELSVLGRALLAPFIALTASFFGFVAWDFAAFNERETGLSTVLAAVPKGSTVLGLYTHFRSPMHYMHDEFYYASSYAVVEAGGLAAPFTTIPQAWRDPRAVPAHPPGGDAAQFSFELHARGFSHFLVRHGLEAGNVADPLASESRVQVVAEAGRWRLYRCLTGCDAR